MYRFIQKMTSLRGRLSIFSKDIYGNAKGKVELASKQLAHIMTSVGNPEHYLASKARIHLHTELDYEEHVYRQESKVR